MNLDALEKGSLALINGEQNKILGPEFEADSSQDSGFFTCLKDALEKVDGLQKEAVKNAEKLALGDQDYLHNTMIAYEKASLALQLTIEVRDKMVEAYQEIMRIQM